MEWVKKQHRVLWQFYRADLGEWLLMTAAAFLLICLLAFGTGLISKSLPEAVVNYFNELLQANDVVSDDGGVNLPALLGNNLRAAAFSVLYGCIPFVYLTALALGTNALVLGILAAYFVNNGASLAVYFAGILPHGVFELPALMLSFALGLLLCKRITQYVRKNPKGMMKPLLGNIARCFLMHILPLLVIASVVETYVTPWVISLFL